MTEEQKSQYPKLESQEIETEGMDTEENLGLSDYRKGKLFLGFLKVLPMLLAGLFLANSILSYFYIDYEIISYLAGVGLIPWLFILAASYKLHFCAYHRVFLWYILINNVICWADSQFRIPITNWHYLVLHIIIAGVFLFFILYKHQRVRNKHKF